MDYGFVPDGTAEGIVIRNYLDWRPGSTTVNTPDPTLQSFVDALTTSGFVQLPVRDLGIGCHGSAYGILQLKLDASSAPRAFFNDVQQVEARGTITIPSGVLDPRPRLGAVEIAAFFRIIGCEIGQARPYLERLKAALGGQVFIIASLHIQALQLLSSLNGVLRFLKYAFSIRAATAFQSRTALVEVFDLQHLAWYDGTPVPRSFWEAMVPTDIVSVGRADYAVALLFQPRLGTTDGILSNAAASWSHIWEPVGPFRVGLPPDPAIHLMSADVRRSFMRQAISANPEFAAGHPFPLYKQRGYASFDLFIDGYDWLPQPDNQLWVGYRHVYQVGVPIGEPPSVPTPPSAFALAVKLPHYDFVTPSGTGSRLGLSETDPLLFTMV